MTSPDSELAARIDELESRLAFQDDLIESLNEVVLQNQRNWRRRRCPITRFRSATSLLTAFGD